MSYTKQSETKEHYGAARAAAVVINIDSLSDAGHEAVSASDLTGYVDNVHAVLVGSQEDPSYLISYDHLNDQLHVHDGADGTSVSSGVGVGEVELLIIGD